MQEGDGGELRIYQPRAGSGSQSKDGAAKTGDGDDANVVRVADVPPVLDTMVLFFSDTRVPHEVGQEGDNARPLLKCARCTRERERERERELHIYIYI